VKIPRLSLAPILILTVVLCGCSWINRYQKDGVIHLPGLTAEVKVMRDEKGMAYIYAGNMHDALVTQGFVTAQDRLFNMELVRLLATGRISELVGEKGRSTDIRMRTIGFARNGARHAAILDAGTKEYLQAYVEGVNAFVRRAEDHPVDFRLAGIKPAPWTITDSLAILYYMGWDTAANLSTEVIAQMLLEKLGEKKAKELLPLCINPEDSAPQTALAFRLDHEPERIGISSDTRILGYLEEGPLKIGSNNWAAGPNLSAGGKPILANDTHNDARILPGLWYPVGIFTPEVRAVGVVVPGLPGIVVGRTSHFAIGVTNSYGDAQDLYIETIDPRNPDRYMEGDVSIPFEVVEETLRIRDKNAPQGFREEKVRIRLTRRGPVISGLIPHLRTDKVITVRWSPFETMEPAIGFDRLLTARSAGRHRADSPSAAPATERSPSP
jgi:penicillin amidase